MNNFQLAWGKIDNEFSDEPAQSFAEGLWSPNNPRQFWKSVLVLVLVFFAINGVQVKNQLRTFDSRNILQRV